MQPATASVRIRRPRAVVGAFVADLSRHEAYLDHFLVDWTITSDDPTGPGAAARLRAKGGGGGAEIDMEIEDVTPERSRSGRAAGGAAAARCASSTHSTTSRTARRR